MEKWINNDKIDIEILSKIEKKCWFKHFREKQKAKTLRKWLGE